MRRGRSTRAGAQVLAATAALATTHASAQGRPDEPAAMSEVVVTASRLGGPLRDVPRSVTVLDRQDVQAQLDINPDLGTILGRTIPGLSTGVEARFNRDGANQIRGRRLQVVLDGVPLNNNFLDFNQDLLGVEAEQIDRIEVIRGGTAIYGFGATGGVVAITTKRPSAKEGATADSKALIGFDANHPENSLSGSVYQDFGFARGPVDVFVSGTAAKRLSRYDADGRRIPEPSAGSFDQTHDYDWTARLGLAIAPGQRLEASAQRYHLGQDDNYGPVGGLGVTRTVATAIPLAPGIGDAAALRLTRGIADPVVFDNDSYRLSYKAADLFGSRVDLTGYRLERYNTTVVQQLNLVRPTATALSRNLVDQVRDGVRLTVDTPVPVPHATDAVLTWGLDYEHQTFTQDNTAGLDPLTPPIAQDAWAGFAQAGLRVLGRVRLTGGLRYESLVDHLDDFTISRTFAAAVAGRRVLGGDLHFDKLIPNAGVVVTLAPWIDAYGSYAQGFTVGELLRALRNTSAASVATAVEAKPQTVDNYEAGLRGAWHGVSYSAAGFYSESALGATFTPDPVTGINFILRAPERVWGAEATLDTRRIPGWSVGGTFAWQEGERRLPGATVYTPLPGNRISPIKLTAYGETKIADRVRLRLQGLYGGSRNEFAGSRLAGEGRVKSLFLLDASVAADLGFAEGVLGVRNLLNRSYVPQPVQALQNTDYIAGEGLGLTATLRRRW